MKYALLFIIAISSISCRKFIGVDPPIDKISSVKIFANEQEATSALVGIYTRMGSVGSRTPIISTGAPTIFLGLYSDELNYTGTSTNEIQFFSNSLLPDNGIVGSDLWNQAYNFIYHANAVIEGVEGSASLDAKVAQNLIVEAKFLRSFLYFHLVNLFGDVPLILKTDYQHNMNQPRTGVDIIYGQMIADLEEAKSRLPVSYPSAQRTRANRWAAAALLARCYLYTGQFEKAATVSTDLINSGTYSLVTNLNNVFVNTSNEVIWQLVPFAISLATIEGFRFIPATGATSLPSYPLTSQLYSSFEAGDLRRTNWTASKTISGQTYYYPYKYKIRAVATGAPVTEYHIHLRYAEQLLLRAEARAMQGDVPGAVADLNLIRQRAGLSPLGTTLTTAQVLTAIAKERRIELFAESGHRFLDLKRRQEINTVLTSKTGWQAMDTLLPIPQAQINANPSLIQNPGY